MSSVGGKAASLMKLYSTPGLSGHVPGGYALAADFFSDWVDQVMASDVWAVAEPKLLTAEAISASRDLKEVAKGLPLSHEQEDILERIRTNIRSWPCQLAAVRSSAPEEDGAGASFAGVFETKLGVTADHLESAVRDCFASVFDHRVFKYAGVHKPAFAAVVMEMVDSYVAGVAFSANPLNSDLDEIMVDSSWGLGESVVDGSVVADRFLWDKIKQQIVEKTVGSKKQERRLDKNGGVQILPVEETRQAQCTLSSTQLVELTSLVSLVEKTYGIPMDTEWAYTESGDLKLLQARPITTLHPLDPQMMTPPGNPRVLYYDYNIASEATTTSPFTHMDLQVYSDLFGIFLSCPDLKISEDPRMLIFNGATRQFMNMSHVGKFIKLSRLASTFETLDPYLASIFRSDDCNKCNYGTKRLPKEINCCSALSMLRKVPFWTMYKNTNKFSDPLKGKEEYRAAYEDFDAKLRILEERGMNDQGVQHYYEELMAVFLPFFTLEMGLINVVLPTFQKMDAQRRTGKSKKERDDADAMCGGFEGDDIMEMNMSMYDLANKLPVSIWNEYKDCLGLLADRIQTNVKNKEHDLPHEFLEAWQAFMKRFGWDASDQMFVSAPRYKDTPEYLLTRLVHSVGESVNDPAVAQQEKIAKRREVASRQEAEAASGCFAMCTVPKLKKRNQCFEHLMAVRNSPKLQISRMISALRMEVLKQQEKLLAAGRLDEKGDIFHLCLPEVDLAMKDPSFNLRAVAAPRKAAYKRAQGAKTCPLLIDSRSRILKPNVVQGLPGTLVGAAISPGIAKGRVRILTSPQEKLETGEVLATVITDPAWTPLFMGCSAVVLQIGGALQHGALCAREFGKPAVSNINVMTELRTGMLVTVDGNTGTVTIENDG